MGSMTIIKDLQYSSGARHRVDLYVPNDSSASPLVPLSLPLPSSTASNHQLPLFIFVHGGGWQRGNKEWSTFGSPCVSRTLASHGICVAAVEYRQAYLTYGATFFRALALSQVIVLLLSLFSHPWSLWYTSIGLVAIGCFLSEIYQRRYEPRAAAPGGIQDVAMSISWIHNNIQKHVPNVSLDHIFIGGHSAGGHMVSLLMTDPIFLARHQLKPSMFKGVVTISGIYDVARPFKGSWAEIVRAFIWRHFYINVFAVSALLHADRHERQVHHHGNGDNNDNTNSESYDIWWTAMTAKPHHLWSPLYHLRHSSAHLRALLPPVLVLNASMDFGLEADGARWARSLQRANLLYAHHVIPKTDHGSICSRFNKHAAHRYVLEYVRSRCDSAHTTPSNSIQ